MRSIYNSRTSWCVLLMLMASSATRAEPSERADAETTNSPSLLDLQLQPSEYKNIQTTNSAPLDANKIELNGESSLIDKIARASVPLVIVEKDGDYSVRQLGHQDDIRTVTLRTGRGRAINRYLREDQTNSSALPALEMSVDWNTATGEYELNRYGVGIFNERLWFLHEIGELDDDEGRFGIQLKTMW